MKDCEVKTLFGMACCVLAIDTRWMQWQCNAMGMFIVHRACIVHTAVTHSLARSRKQPSGSIICVTFDNFYINLLIIYHF